MTSIPCAMASGMKNGSVNSTFETWSMNAPMNNSTSIIRNMAVSGVILKAMISRNRIKSNRVAILIISLSMR